MSEIVAKGAIGRGLVLVAGLWVLTTGVSAQPRDYFGAIAFAMDNGAYGYAYNFKSRSAAEDEAMRECRDQGGTGCQIVVWFRNACGALATTTGMGYGADWAATDKKAEGNAMEACLRYNQSCSTAQVVCTDRFLEQK